MFFIQLTNHSLKTMTQVEFEARGGLLSEVLASVDYHMNSTANEFNVLLNNAKLYKNAFILIKFSSFHNQVQFLFL